MGQEAGVLDEHAWCAHHACRDAGCPSLHAHHQMQQFEKADIGAGRLLVDGERLSYRSHCDQGARTGCQMAKENREQVRASNVDEIGNVSRHERRDVVVEPCAAPARRAADQRWESSRGDALGMRRATHRVRLNGRGCAALPNIVQPARHRSTNELSLGERSKRYAFDASRQRVADPRREKKVGRARHEEPPRTRITVDRDLEGQHQFRRALQLVDERAITRVLGNPE